jgi:hypothetical protein
MILDAQNQFSDAQAISGDATGTNVIDLGVDKSLGDGEAMAVLFTVDVAADQTTGDEDYEFEVEYASDAAQTTARKQVGGLKFESGTPDAPALNADLLVAGFQFAIPVPPAALSMSERYLGVRYDVTGTTPTITITANLVPQSFIEKNRVYADNSTITT